MNVQRLTLLKEILLDLDTRHVELVPTTRGDKYAYFDMASFADSQHACGTSACAAGVAALHPAFIAEGLELKNTIPWPESWPEYGLPRLTPTYDGRQDFEALEAFFDITVKEAEYLFLGEKYHSPQCDDDTDVVARADCSGDGDCMEVEPADVAGHIDDLLNGTVSLVASDEDDEG